MESFCSYRLLELVWAFIAFQSPSWWSVLSLLPGLAEFLVGLLCRSLDSLLVENLIVVDVQFAFCQFYNFVVLSGLKKRLIGSFMPADALHEFIHAIWFLEFCFINAFWYNGNIYFLLIQGSLICEKEGYSTALRIPAALSLYITLDFVRSWLW